MKARDQSAPRGKVALKWYECAVDLEESLEAVRAEVQRMRGQLAEEARIRDRVDRLYQEASGYLATMRLILDAPNPCDLIAWTRKVKTQAGHVEGGLEDQAGPAVDARNGVVRA